MARWAIVENDVVINIIIADTDFAKHYFPNAINVDDLECGVGAIYKDGSFITSFLSVEEIIE